MYESIENVSWSVWKVTELAPSIERWTLLELQKVFEKMENLEDQMDNFYTAISNVSNGIIRQNEIDNLLKDENPLFDFYKIMDKINRFLYLSPLSESFCSKCCNLILKIQDKKPFIGSYSADYADFVDFCNKKFWRN